jgi:hypothetical protein
MKKAISMLTAVILTLIAALPVGAASATGDEALLIAAEPVKDTFNLGLATTLIIIICSVLTAGVVITAIYLARKNRHN